MTASGSCRECRRAGHRESASAGGRRRRTAARSLAALFVAERIPGQRSGGRGRSSHADEEHGLRSPDRGCDDAGGDGARSHPLGARPVAGPHPHPDGARRAGGPHRGTRAWRRRLSAQALRAARIGAALRRAAQARRAAGASPSRSEDGRSGVRSRSRRTQAQGQAGAADQFGIRAAEAVRRQCRTALLPHRPMHPPRRGAGALHRRASDAAPAQDRGGSQAAALYPDHARRGLCAGAGPGGLNMKGLHPFRALKRTMPRGLFGRSLIIIVAPVVILQGIVTYIFFERHYDIMLARMGRNVAADVAFLVNLEETHPAGPERKALLDGASRTLGYQIAVLPGEHLGRPYRHSTPNLKDAMTAIFAGQLGQARPFTSREIGDFVDLKVQVKDGVLAMMIPRKRLVASNVDIFILWMVGSSLVLLAVAILFLRNQVRPIEQLALASESFGKGRAVPDFKPYGATEVRRPAQSSLTMRDRIERYVSQRTKMLASVSHDLKTPLPRLKLELAMMADSADVSALQEDVAEMEHMLDEYLDFARGEGGEDSQVSDLASIVNEAAAAAGRARRAGPERLTVETEPGISLSVKRNALKRCTTNLIDNALKHGAHVAVALRRNGHQVEIVVDDDGPGIPEERREEAFRPFHRLDQGRNLQKGGSGLGLAIARDIARAHGGELILDESALGGLRAAIRLPV